MGLVRISSQLFIPTAKEGLGNNNGRPQVRYLENNEFTNLALEKFSGSSIEFLVDTSNYKLTLNLKNASGTTISSGIVDLPLESVVVNATYTNGILTLILQNGNSVDVDISDIVRGLISDVKLNGTSLAIDGVVNIVADTTPTSGSSNLITSGAVYNAIEEASGVTLDTTQTITGQKTFSANKTYINRLEITSTSDVDGTSDTTSVAPLLIGSKTGAHIEIDPNEILGKASANTAGNIYMQTNGGEVNIGDGVPLETVSTNRPRLRVRGDIMQYGAFAMRGVDYTNYQGYFKLAETTINNWYKPATAKVFIQDIDNNTCGILNINVYMGTDGALSTIFGFSENLSKRDYQGKFFLVYQQDKSARTTNKVISLWYHPTGTYSRIIAHFLEDFGSVRETDPVGVRWSKYWETSANDGNLVTAGVTNLTKGYVIEADWASSLFVTTDYPDVNIIADGNPGDYFAVCYTAAGTAAKTVTIPNYTLRAGNLIPIYFVNANSASNPTLNINGTGAKAIYVDNAAATSSNLNAGWNTFYYNGTYYYAGNTLPFTSDSSWNTMQVRHNVAIQAGEAITANRLIAGRSDNKYYMVGANKAIDLRFPILYANSAITSGSTGTNNYSIRNQTAANMLNNGSSLTVTNYAPIFLVGTISGTTFTTLSSGWYTQSMPTSDNSNYYLLVGYAYSTTQIRLVSEHKVYRRINGVFKELIPSYLSAEPKNAVTSSQNGRIYPVGKLYNTSTYDISLGPDTWYSSVYYIENQNQLYLSTGNASPLQAAIDLYHGGTSYSSFIIRNGWISKGYTRTEAAGTTLGMGSWRVTETTTSRIFSAIDSFLLSKGNGKVPAVFTQIYSSQLLGTNTVTPQLNIIADAEDDSGLIEASNVNAFAIKCRKGSATGAISGENVLAFTCPDDSRAGIVKARTGNTWNSLNFGVQKKNGTWSSEIEFVNYSSEAVSYLDPLINKGIDLGQSSRRWRYVYCQQVYSDSDKRIKENIKEPEFDCEKLVDELPVYEFNFIEDKEKVTQIGIIAQELKEALPEKYRDGIVIGDEDTTYSVCESKLIFILWNALKKEREKTKNLEERIEKLESKMNKILNFLDSENTISR